MNSFLSSAPDRHSSFSCFLYHSPPSNYLRKLYGKCTNFSGEIYLVFAFSHSDTSIFYFTVRKMWQNCNTSYKSKWIITVLLSIIKMARTWQYTLKNKHFQPDIIKPPLNYLYQNPKQIIFTNKLVLHCWERLKLSVNSNTVPLCSITINFKHTYHLPCTR